MATFKQISIYLLLATSLFFVQPTTTIAQPIAELIYAPIDTVQQLEQAPIAKKKKRTFKKSPTKIKDKGDVALITLVVLYIASFIVGLILFCIGFPLGLLALWLTGVGLEAFHLLLVGIGFGAAFGKENRSDGMGSVILAIILLVGLTIFCLANGIALFILGLAGLWWLSLIGGILFLMGFITLLLFKVL